MARDGQVDLFGTPIESPGSGAGGRKWTDAQLRGIRTTGHSLLVSAAAGSGKTAMLAERCAYLICEADEPCEVTELLVVTFTEAAAAEMKGRIGRAVRDRIAASADERLRRQADLVDQMQIGTLHGFCARVLRQHFHLIGLDPAFGVLDAEEARLLRSEVARQLFDDAYELDESGAFQQFVDAYGDGDDARLTRQVIKTHELLTSLVDPAEWIGRARRRIQEGAKPGAPLEQSELGRELGELVERGLEACAARCERAIDLVGRLGGFDKYLDVLRDCRNILADWRRTFRADGLDALCEVAEVEFPKLPSISKSVPNKELAKSAVDSVRDEMKKGPWRALLRFQSADWQQGLASIESHANVFLNLVEQFGQRYEQAKEAIRALDFSDLERFTLKVLRDDRYPGLTPTWAARSYHRRFKHVLVDEYQDINEVQDAILALVSRECVADEPRTRTNLFCVGDVKQSIYRFRLAEAARFLDRQRLFRSYAEAGAADGGARVLGGVIDLQHNFRSRAKLLNALNEIFARLMSAEAVDITYEDSHRLTPGQQYPEPDDGSCFAGAPLELHLLPAKPQAVAEEGEEQCDDDSAANDLDRAEREAVLVARRIREIVGLEGGRPMCVTEKDAAGNFSPRPARFADIVILLRSMRYKADQYAEVLRQAGVPVHSESGTGYFESTEVRDLLALLSLLNNQRQDVPMAAVLRGPLGGLADAEDCLARIRLAYPAGRGHESVPFHEAVARYARERDDELAAHLRDFLNQLDRWRASAHRRPLAETIWDIYEETGLLAFVAGLHDGEQRQANLLDLHQRARQFGRFHRQGLARFMQFLDHLRAESDLGKPPVVSETQDVVRIMSVHHAKGLEFPVVVLPDLGKAFNLDDCAGSILADRRAGLGMSAIDDARKIRYPSLASVLVRQRLRQQSLAEEMRVLYVATTRAKEHLILVGTCGEKEPERWRARWGGDAPHAGPFPADAVLGAGCMLDWIGPVAAAAGPRVIEVHAHDAAEVLAFTTPAKQRPTLSAEQQRMAALEPLDPPPPAMDPVAQDVIDRLTSTYPYQPFAELPAAVAMTDRNVRAAAAPHSRRAKDAPATSLPKPRFLLEAGALAAADVGEATHLALLHLDFARPCDEADVARQLEEIVARRLLAPAQASAIDRASIVWLCRDTPLGKVLRDHARTLRRELPVFFAEDGTAPDGGGPLPAADPLDRVMVRGRIDVLVPRAADSVLIDYKTDAVAPPDVPARAELYRPQLRRYRQAVERITGKPVGEAYVVFLAARVLVTT